MWSSTGLCCPPGTGPLGPSHACPLVFCLPGQNVLASTHPREVGARWGPTSCHARENQGHPSLVLPPDTHASCTILVHQRGCTSCPPDLSSNRNSMDSTPRGRLGRLARPGLFHCFQHTYVSSHLQRTRRLSVTCSTSRSSHPVALFTVARPRVSSRSPASGPPGTHL